MGNERAWNDLMIELLAQLESMRDRLPPTGVRALEVAQNYWDGRAGQLADLSDAKAACWQYLDAHSSNSTEIGREDQRLVRAILCVLEPAGDAEAIANTSEWFATMVDRGL